MKRSPCMQVPSADFSDLHELTLLLQTNHPDLDVVDMELDPLGPLHDHGVSALTGMLRQNCVVTEVNLANNGFGRAGAEAVGDMLSSNSTVRGLDLADNDIGDDGLEAIATALGEGGNATLQSLRLTNAGLGPKTGWALRATLGANATLLTLDLCGNALGARGMVDLAQGLGDNTAITALHLDANSMGDAGAKSLGSALTRGNRSLHILHLNDNYIADDGCAALAAGLCHCPGLTALFLRDNAIGDKGANEVGKVLRGSKHLVSLSLGGNDLRAHGAHQLANGALDCKSLRTLCLDHNPVYDAGAEKLAGIFVPPKTGAAEKRVVRRGAPPPPLSAIDTLDLSGCNIGDNACPHLRAMLTHGEALRSLSLAENSIGDDGVENLYWGVLSNRGCVMLDLQHNPCHTMPTASHPWLVDAIDRVLALSVAARPAALQAAKAELEQRVEAATTVASLLRGFLGRRRAARVQRRRRVCAVLVVRVQAMVRAFQARALVKHLGEEAAEKRQADLEARADATRAREERQLAEEAEAAREAAGRRAEREQLARAIAAATRLQALARGRMARARVQLMKLRRAGLMTGTLNAMPGTIDGETGWYSEKVTSKVAYFTFDAKGEQQQVTAPPLPEDAWLKMAAEAKGSEFPVPCPPQLRLLRPPPGDKSSGKLYVEGGSSCTLMVLGAHDVVELERRMLVARVGAWPRESFAPAAAAAAAAAAHVSDTPAWQELGFSVSGIVLDADAFGDRGDAVGAEQQSRRRVECELRVSVVMPDGVFVEIWRSERQRLRERQRDDARGGNGGGGGGGGGDSGGGLCCQWPSGLVAGTVLYGAEDGAFVFAVVDDSAAAPDSDVSGERKTNSEDSRPAESEGEGGGGRVARRTSMTARAKGRKWLKAREEAEESNNDAEQEPERTVALECVAFRDAEDVGGVLAGRTCVTLAQLLASKGAALPLFVAVPDGAAVSFEPNGRVCVDQCRAVAPLGAFPRGPPELASAAQDYDAYVGEVQRWYREEARARGRSRRRRKQWRAFARVARGAMLFDAFAAPGQLGAGLFLRLKFAATFRGRSGLKPSASLVLSRPTPASIDSGAGLEWVETWRSEELPSTLTPGWACTDELLAVICGDGDAATSSPLQIECFDGAQLIAALQTTVDMLRAGAGRGDHAMTMLHPGAGECTLRVIKCEMVDAPTVAQESAQEGYENYIARLRQAWLHDHGAALESDDERAWIRDAWVEAED